MTACCKGESNETIPTYHSNKSGARGGAEEDLKRAHSDTSMEQRCSGELCDGMALQCPMLLPTSTDALT